jgi:phage RecT family recombinase
MENTKTQLMQLIQTATPAQLIQSVEVADRFKQLYKVIHGIKNEAVAESFYHAEKFHFLKLVQENPRIAECSKLSLYGVFMDVAVSGLSFDPSMKHLYIVPYKFNVGTKQDPRWESRAALQIDGRGELLLRQLQGQVKYVDNPVVVYEGDEFKFGTRDGKALIEHMAAIPRKNDKMLACYLRITRHDDTVDYKVMTLEDLMQLRKFSKDENSTAWTKGIAGMFMNKTIKHAFKNYPKLRVGEFSQLASETVDEDGEVMPTDLYGLGEAASTPVIQQPKPSTVQTDFAEPSVNGKQAAFQVDDDTF